MATDNLPVAQYSSAYIATTLEAYYNKPQVVPELRSSFGQGILMFDLITMMKNDNEFVASESWEAHEENPPFRTMTIGGTVTVGGTAATDHVTFNLAVGDVDSHFKYLPRAGQSFWVGSAQNPREFVIKTVTATGGTDGATCVAYQKDSSSANAITTIANYVKPTQTFALSPAVNSIEGGAATTPTHVGWRRDTFYTQVMKDALGWENAEFAREHWVTVSGGKLYSKEIARMDTNLDAAMESAIWLGSKNTNTGNLVMTTAANSDSRPIPGTQGIWDWIGERGYDLDFNNTTDFTVEHFYELSEYGESVGLPGGEWMMSAGGDLLRRIEKACKSYITNATGSLSDMFISGQADGQKALTVGFSSVSVDGGNTKVILHKNHIFNNPYLFGISTFGFKDAAAVFPLMDVRTKGGGLVPNLSIKYRGLPGYANRKRAFAPFLGVGGPSFIGAPVTLTSDISQVHALTDFGLEYLEAWRGVRIYNTDITNQI